MIISRLKFSISLFIACFCLLLNSHFVTAQEKMTAKQKALKNLSWRSIGPANMGGRVSDVIGVPGNPNLVYVGTASGGVWKTTDAGTNWKPIFEREGTISVGDMEIEPGNPDVIWVGTGESNARNSVSFGDGVYKSTDGGKTWKHMGLKDTNSISKIIINPRNPNVVYVAALGHIWGSNKDRGVFMTTDGGKTWKKTLYIDEMHGASDLVIDPNNPNILYAGMWKFQRKPWTFVSGSDKGGVFRSVDGGLTWKKLTKGLPKMVGRVGLAVAASNTDVVYAIFESKTGTLFRSDDKGENFRQVSKAQNIVARGFYYTTVTVDPTDENKVYAVASQLFRSLDGGRNFRRISPTTHIDFHSLWIDPTNPKRMWQGQDGGVAVTYDGNNWEYKNNFAIGQFYQISADNSEPFYRISGGMQDNGTWNGPSRTREPAGILNDDWRMLSFGDGFFVIAHPDDSKLFLSESQGGNIVRTDMKNREQQRVNPYFGLGGAPENDKYRFNWNAPIIPSPHDKNTVWFAGNVVYKSTDFGKNWTKVSDDLTKANPERLKDAGGPIFTENTAAEYFATILSLDESPLKKDVVWVGTDDGNLQITNDGGKNWSNITSNLPNVPADSSISHVELSNHNANTAYIAIDRHKFDDYKPYVFKTTDGGRTFRNITGNITKNAYVHVVREDLKNPNIIYAGTELGIFVTYNGGGSWMELNMKNFPKVAVHDIVLHPRENDIILGTHGRSIWVFDDATPIQNLSDSILQKDAHLFAIRPTHRFTTRFTRYGISDEPFRGANPPSGALITYYLKDKPDKKTKLKLEIFDAQNKKIAEVKNLPKMQGLNRTFWNLRHEGATPRRQPTGQQATRLRQPNGPAAMPGIYTVKMIVNDKVVGETKAEVRVDPTVKVTNSELQAQFDLAMKLRDMLSPFNKGLRMLDSAKSQTANLEKVAKTKFEKIPEDLSKAFKDYKKKIDTLSKSLAIPQGQGIRASAKITNEIGGIYFSVIGANAAPTKTMQDKYQELTTRAPAKLAEINRFINEDTKQFNELMQKNGLPFIVMGSL